MNQRTQALAREDAAIASNVATIEAQKAQRPSAIQAMASRLNISPGNLQKTLLDTVFKNASESEFAALIVVANEYGLNPLTKEIYAFPAKGGGIVPVVSIDGWIRIANSHPQYDGSEQNFIYDENKKLFAVETTIYRKDRGHPIKKMEFLSECKRGTEPWKMEHRMLGHKGFIQAARYAFGFAGIYDEDDADIVVQSYINEPVSVPSSRRLQQQEQQQQREPEPQPSYDDQTGEIYDDPDADAAAEREADRLMNGGDQYEEREEDNVNDVQAALEEPRWKLHYRDTLENVMAAKNVSELNKVEKEFVNHRATYDDDAIQIVEREIKNARTRLTP